jgi:hypothetical protein
MNGRRIAYSADELLFVCARRHLPRAELHWAFVAKFGRRDVEVRHLKALCTRNGWTTDRAAFSPDDDAVLRERFADTATAQLAADMGRSYGSVVARAKLLGLRKSDAFRASRASGRLQRGDRIGAATAFKKGHAPKNKGVKRPEGWAPGRMRETQFGAGMPSWNTKPIGSVRVIDGYEFTKVKNGDGAVWTANWKQTHVIKWEALHGPIPVGHCLKCADGDQLNTAPTNWHLIPRTLLPRLNGSRGTRLRYDAAPAELKPILLTTAKLAHAISRRRAHGGANVAATAQGDA